jgi:predicted phosphoribosyltransferase
MNVMQAELNFERSSGGLLLQSLNLRERMNEVMREEIQSLRKEREIMLAMDLKQGALLKQTQKQYEDAAKRADTYRKQRNVIAGGGGIVIVIAVVIAIL